MPPTIYALLLVIGTGDSAMLLDSKRRFDSLKECRVAEKQEHVYTGRVRTTARCVNVSYFYGGE
jgi:hypothetical protein